MAFAIATVANSSAHGPPPRERFLPVIPQTQHASPPHSGIGVGLPLADSSTPPSTTRNDPCSYPAGQNSRSGWSTLRYGAQLSGSSGLLGMADCVMPCLDYRRVFLGGSLADRPS